MVCTKIYELKKVNRQMISFIDKENQVKVSREIIYPLENSQKKISSYFFNSIPRAEYLCIDFQEECLCIYNNRLQLNSNYPTKIDRFWLDGETYLIEYQKGNISEIVIVVIDRTLNKEDVINFLKQNMLGNQILFIDQLSNCWIKREGA